MNKNVFSLTAAALLISVGLAQAIPAQLVMGNGKVWEGMDVKRDGDWVEFSTGPGTKPIRVGADTIKEMVFEVKLDEEKLNELNRDQLFERVIAALDNALEPFSDFGDIPSNLTLYNALLMELHYKIGNFDKSLAISAKIATDDRDPVLQSKAQVFHALALIDAGRTKEAETYVVKLGWDKQISEDAAPEKLYIMAKLMALKKQYNLAMELVARVIAFNSQDPDWMQPAELLCAEVYTELGMFDSAEEVIRQISLLYKGSVEDTKAKSLKIRIEGLRVQKEQDTAESSEEA